MSLTSYGKSGLQGWKGTVGERVAEQIARRTRFERDQVAAAIGAVIFLLALRTVVKTAADALRHG